MSDEVMCSRCGKNSDICGCESEMGINIKSIEQVHDEIKNNKVNHPSHYNQGKYEVIDVIEDWGLNFHLGNAVKYIARCEHKGDKEADLRKAIFYLEREIERGNKHES